MSYFIESNIPIPESKIESSRKSDLAKALEKMEVSQSIVVESDSSNFHGAVINIARRIKIKTTIRKIKDNGPYNGAYRIWKIK
jgi:TusA-related sulfurtransferase